MIAEHLTDDQVQQCAEESSMLIPEVLKHLEFCGECKSRAEVYRLLISGIRQQPETVFDFNLPGLVVSKLPSSKPGVIPDRFLGYALVFAGIFLTGISLAVFNRYMTSFFSGMDTLFIYMIMAPAATILTGMCIETYKNFKSKMDALNFH